MSTSKLHRLRSKFDGLRIIMREWQTEEPAKAVLIMVHGIGEHSKVYDPWASKFLEKNIAVVSFDQRGHGLSSGKRGHIPMYRALTSDLALIYRFVREKYHQIPILIYGHSMGGNVVLNFLTKPRRHIAAGIVASPWVSLAFEPPFYKVFLGRLMSIFWPDYSDSNKTSLEAEIKVDKEKDPLLHDKISITTYLECKKAGKRILNKANLFKLPILLLHGKMDKRTSWQSTKNLHDKLEEPKSNLILYPEAEHELHEWENNQLVYTDIIKWIETTLDIKL